MVLKWTPSLHRRTAKTLCAHQGITSNCNLLTIMPITENLCTKTTFSSTVLKVSPTIQVLWLITRSQCWTISCKSQLIKRLMMLRSRRKVNRRRRLPTARRRLGNQKMVRQLPKSMGLCSKMSSRQCPRLKLASSQIFLMKKNWSRNKNQPSRLKRNNRNKKLSSPRRPPQNH